MFITPCWVWWRWVRGRTDRSPSTRTGPACPGSSPGWRLAEWTAWRSAAGWHCRPRPLRYHPRPSCSAELDTRWKAYNDVRMNKQNTADVLFLNQKVQFYTLFPKMQISSSSSSHEDLPVLRQVFHLPDGRLVSLKWNSHLLTHKLVNHNYRTERQKHVATEADYTLFPIDQHGTNFKRKKMK